MQPDDVPLMVAMFHQLSPESRRRRFHTNVEHVSDELIYQRAGELANVDNETNRGALIAIYAGPAGEEMVGSVRLARPADKPDSLEAEAAIVVRDDFQGQGVGQELLRRMVLLAKKMRVKTIVAIFEPDNEGAIRLFRELNLPSELTIHHGETIMRIAVPA
ncbi:MAG: GNAT family N-acetyltransferase [Anaerolineales bacterium]|nr:GNAT family N-acetyltransferase [Anaerolineales bacterium]